MKTTHQRELDQIVRRLAPIDDDTVRAALHEHDTDTFARGLMNASGAAELTVIETPPRPARPVRRRFAPALVAAAVVVFATATFTVLPLGTSQPAIAGWGPEPSEATPALLETAVNECPPPAGAGASEQLNTFMASNPTLVGVDMRGTAAAAVFADDTQYFVCNLVEENGSWLVTSGMHAEPDRAGGPIDADSEHQWVYGEMTLTTVVGLIDASVTHVSVELADGTELEASIGDGMFIAWWPSQKAFARADAYDTAGELLGTDDSVTTSGFETDFED